MAALIAGCCLTSSTRPRRFLTRLAGWRRPPRWVTSRSLWRLYGALEWAALRAQDAAMILEDEGR